MKVLKVVTVQVHIQQEHIMLDNLGEDIGSQQQVLLLGIPIVKVEKVKLRDVIMVV